MPFGDRKGPRRLGSMTGRAAGYCAGFPSPGYVNRVPGRRYGFTPASWGSGFTSARGGYGVYRHPFSDYISEPFSFKQPSNLTTTNEQEAAMFKDQIKEMENTISEMKKRIQELESKRNST